MPERSRELRTVLELALALAGTPPGVDETLARICDETRSALGFRRALVIRLDGDTETVGPIAEHGAGLPLERFPLLTRARDARRAVFAVADPPCELARELEVRALIAAPLTVEDRCLGFLVTGWDDEHAEPGEEDMRLLTALAWIGAVFVEQAGQLERLEEALELQHRLERARSEFVSIASHELRTPLAVVHGIASTLHLRAGELDAGRERELRRALFEQTARLVELAEQLLDLSRIDAGAVRTERRRFRPYDLVRELLPRLVPERAAEVSLEIEPALELESDPAALERVLANLIVNAFRYGAPPVRVRAEAGGEIRLIVEDSGPGVPRELQPRLFDRFSRGESARSEPGAGLGLAIAQSYAAALGASLRYEDAEPTGARFTLALPADAAA